MTGGHFLKNVRDAMYHNVEHKNFTSPGAANLAQLTPCHMTPVAKEAAPSENSESRFVNGPGSVNKKSLL